MGTFLNEKRYQTQWLADQKLIRTELSGDLEIEEIKLWQRSLLHELEKIEDHGVFKIFVDLHGFTAINLEAHKYFRTIIPVVLSQYGWKVGYVDLFDEANLLSYTFTRGIRCVAAAHAHHDQGKIEKYEANYSRDDEHYFTDPELALNWIRQYPV
jgi:hypothetical protein